MSLMWRINLSRQSGRSGYGRTQFGGGRITVTPARSGSILNARPSLQLTPTPLILHPCALHTHGPTAAGRRHSQIQEHEEGVQKPVAKPTPVTPTSNASSTSTPPTPPPPTIFGRIKTVYQLIRFLLHHYKLGCKLLWKNYQEIRRIKASAESINYLDAAHLRRTKTDLQLGIPFVLVFLLPIVGNLAPVFAYFAPRYVPSTFHQTHHLRDFMRTDSTASRQVLASLLEVYDLHSQACSMDKLNELIRRIEKGQGRIGSLCDLFPLAPIMDDLTPKLESFPRSHLLLIHQATRHSGFVVRYFYTKGMLCTSLKSWHELIWREDQLLQSYGMDQLTVSQLVAALYDRGIYQYPTAMSHVICKAQQHALQSVDKKKSIPTTSDSSSNSPPAAIDTNDSDTHSTLPPPPTPEIIQHWRRTLREWILLHSRLQAAVTLSTDANKKPSTAAALASNTAIEPTPLARAATECNIPPPEPVSSSSPIQHTLSVDGEDLTSDGSAPVLNKFPLTFLLHVPSLARVIRSNNRPTNSNGHSIGSTTTTTTPINYQQRRSFHTTRRLMTPSAPINSNNIPTISSSTTQPLNSFGLTTRPASKVEMNLLISRLPQLLTTMDSRPQLTRFISDLKSMLTDAPKSWFQEEHNIILKQTVTEVVTHLLKPLADTAAAGLSLQAYTDVFELLGQLGPSASPPTSLIKRLCTTFQRQPPNEWRERIGQPRTPTENKETTTMRLPLFTPTQLSQFVELCLVGGGSELASSTLTWLRDTVYSNSPAGLGPEAYNPILKFMLAPSRSDISQARTFFDDIPKKNSDSFHLMLDGYVRTQQFAKSSEILQLFLASGLEIDRATVHARFKFLIQYGPTVTDPLVRDGVLDDGEYWWNLTIRHYRRLLTSEVLHTVLTFDEVMFVPESPMRLQRQAERIKQVLELERNETPRQFITAVSNEEKKSILRQWLQDRTSADHLSMPVPSLPSSSMDSHPAVNLSLTSAMTVQTMHSTLSSLRHLLDQHTLSGLVLVNAISLTPFIKSCVLLRSDAQVIEHVVRACWNFLVRRAEQSQTYYPNTRTGQLFIHDLQLSYAACLNALKYYQQTGQTSQIRVIWQQIPSTIKRMHPSLYLPMLQSFIVASSRGATGALKSANELMDEYDSYQLPFDSHLISNWLSCCSVSGDIETAERILTKIMESAQSGTRILPGVFQKLIDVFLVAGQLHPKQLPRERLWQSIEAILNEMKSLNIQFTFVDYQRLIQTTARCRHYSYKNYWRQLAAKEGIILPRAKAKTSQTKNTNDHKVNKEEATM